MTASPSPPPPKWPSAAGIFWACLLLAACGKPLDPRVVVGTLERDRVELVAEAHEPIIAILAGEGERVQEGQPILQLDTALIEAQSRQLIAALTRQEARLAELERGPREERILEARARVRGAEAALIDALRDVARYEALVEAGAAPSVRVDAARLARDTARARVDEARAALDALIRGTTSEELSQAQAAVREATQAIAALAIRADRMTIRASRAGTVEALPYERGDRPLAGATVAVLLVDGPPYARIFIPETILAHVRIGTKASIRADGLAAPVSGSVRRISSEAAFTPYYLLTEQDRGHLAYLAEIQVDGSDQGLPSGLPVQVSFDIPAL